MFSHNGKVSTRQIMILLILQMLNMNILVIPRVCTNYLGRNGYLAPIIAIFIGILYLLCITSLTKKFGDKTFVEIVTDILPKWIGYLVLLLLVLKLIVSTGLELRMFGEVLRQIMLPKTPIAVIMIVLILATAYLIQSGVEATARMGEILIYLIAVPLVIAILIIVFKTDYKQVLPFFQLEIGDAVWGTVLTSFIFIPLETLLIMNGLMKKPEMVRKAGIGAIVVIGILQALLTLLCITQNGLKETQNQLWPVIILMKSMGMNDTIVENQEVLMLIVWILSVYMYISVNSYVITFIGSKSFKFKRENIFVLPIIPIILLVALYPSDLGVVYESYLKFEYYYGLWFVIPIPLILLIIAKIKEGRV